MIRVAALTAARIAMQRAQLQIASGLLLQSAQSEQLTEWSRKFRKKRREKIKRGDMVCLLFYVFYYLYYYYYMTHEYGYKNVSRWPMVHLLFIAYTAIIIIHLFVLPILV